MASVLLGSGAAEGVPSTMCDCPVCERARKLKGKNVRTRSDFLIDETAMIDVSPDLFFQLLNCGIHLRNLKNIFLTHFHDDHICVPELASVKYGVPSRAKTVYLYGSAAALEQVRLLFGRYKDQTDENAYYYFGDYHLIPLKPFTEYQIDGMNVTPILSSHHGYGIHEIGYNYIITDAAGKTFLYALDTGWYGEETWVYLKQIDIGFDYVVIESTCGDKPLPKRLAGHLNFDNMLEMVETMESYGLLTKQTPIILSHIGHHLSKTHEEAQKLLNESPYRIWVGYDGMVIRPEDF